MKNSGIGFHLVVKGEYYAHIPLRIFVNGHFELIDIYAADIINLKTSVFWRRWGWELSRWSLVD